MRRYLLFMLLCATLGLWAEPPATPAANLPQIHMVNVPAGAFHNGRGTVTISAFMIASQELSQEIYEAVMSKNPALNFGVDKSLPVYNVSFYDAIEFCNRLSIAQNLQPAYCLQGFGSNPDDWPVNWQKAKDCPEILDCDWQKAGYRLPTEMEWVYAAKGGCHSPEMAYSEFGGTSIVLKEPAPRSKRPSFEPDNSTSNEEVVAILADYAWFEHNNQTNTGQPVGSKSPNQLGLYDMAGNVNEWVWDAFAKLPKGEHKDPRGPVRKANRVIKGGAWDAEYAFCKVSSRAPAEPDKLYAVVGIRLARTLLEAPEDKD